MDRIEQRADFNFIRYANCWEDATILCEALQPTPGKRMLAIASAGDNVFSLLARGAAVVAADLNPAQLALVELRRAAIAELSQPQCLAFFGITAAANRLATWEQLKPALSDRTREFWLRNPQLLADGIIHAGKFERYFQRFRRLIMPLIHSRKTIAALMADKSLEARRHFYETRWNTIRWNLLFKCFFSRAVMGRLGRDPEFFKYVEGSVSERILARTRYAMTELSTFHNPYLNYILLGNFQTAIPDYLDPARYSFLQANLSKLTLHLGPIEQAGETYRDGRFDGFNLSDIFEYMDTDSGRAIYARLLALANPGARFAYWNMLAPRQFAEHFPGQLRTLPAISQSAFAKDLAFFYSRFIVEETVP